MKNCFKLMSLLLGMALCTTAFVACGDDDDNGKKGGVPDADEITVNDLIGTWTVNSSDNSYVAIFTKDNV